jgi:hypothetical protein
MKVDALKLISGIKPAVLKGLLRKDRFEGRRYFVNGSPVELLTTLESVDRAAALWFESMRSRIRGLGLEIV